MRHVIIVNPQAMRLRKDTRMRAEIRKQFSDYAYIIDHHGRGEVLAELTCVAARGNLKTIFVVGGDGTFNDILNWIVDQPTETRPILVSVGGGQFCYMTKFQGFRSSNPLRNLHDIFTQKVKLQRRKWRPLRLHDPSSETIRHAALFSNGIICDIIDWYDSTGKGGLLNVMKIGIGAILSVLFERIRLKQNRIHLSEAALKLDSEEIHQQKYAGFVFGAVPQLVTTCQPFRGTPGPKEFWSLVCLGSLRRLALAGPFLWFGKILPWMRSEIFNDTIAQAIITTRDARLVIDGDLVCLKGDPHQLRVLSFSIGEPIPLFVVDRN